MDEVTITRHPVSGWVLQTRQELGSSIDEVFSFFSDARNLEAITPGFLKFEVLTDWPIEMGVGTIIDYRLKVHHIPIRWQSRINEWEVGVRFVDEQVVGPYKLWLHEHSFKEEGGRTVVGDEVHYDVTGGGLVHGLFVKRDLIKIFEYRQRKLGEVFGEY